MRSMPRVYRNFAELERAELSGADLDIDELLDEMFADELDIDFDSRRRPGVPPCTLAPDNGLPTRTRQV